MYLAYVKARFKLKHIRGTSVPGTSLGVRSIGPSVSDEAVRSPRLKLQGLDSRP